MKKSNASIAPASTINKVRTVQIVIVMAALAIVAATAVTATGAVATATPETKTPSANPNPNPKTPPVLKPVSYKSRNYGVSFDYPWQYSYVNARTIAASSADASLRPKSDGRDSQIALARIDIPKGDYDGTNFESGYFTLSLDREIASESECEATFHVLQGGKIENDSVNGAAFHWIDVETKNGDQATKLRRYVTYTNGACYEVEMGVNTSNQDGLSREVNPDTVMLRLDRILRTLEIAPNQKTVTVETASSKEDPKPASHN
jgi:hypothetical protein